jgi:hypothetical protein
MRSRRIQVLRAVQRPGSVQRQPRLVKVPSSEQPVRASKVSELVALALQLAPPGIHIAAPEMVWRAAQADLHETARQWLRP